MTETKTQKIEVKLIKHTFTTEERNGIGGDLARAIAGLRGTEAEFDKVKAAYKARTTEAEAQIDSLSTSLMNGFEMRNTRCVVLYRPKDRKKDYYAEEAYKADTEGAMSAAPLLTEDMNPDDFQQELMQAESAFENREEIQLFQPTGADNGVLVVGKLKDRWYSALRVQIGKLQLNERLDSEQKAFKERADAVAHAVKRVDTWAKENLKDAAKGFEASFKAVAEAHKERAE